MAGNSASLSVTCNECFSSTSEGWAEYWALQPQTLTKFMESSSKWFSLPMSSSKHFAALGSQLVCCLSPGIITVTLCFHNPSTTLFQLLLTIHLERLWLEWRRQRRIFISLTLATACTYLHYPPFFISQKCLCGTKKPENKKFLPTTAFQFQKHPGLIVFIWQWGAANYLPGIMV